MDGFQLLENIRKDASLEKLPVIVVSSMESREDQERGLALGANAFIVKRKFDQRELIRAVRRIL
jgi:two-component system chemotaxis sensor kinase CheA